MKRIFHQLLYRTGKLHELFSAALCMSYSFVHRLNSLLILGIVRKCITQLKIYFSKCCQNSVMKWNFCIHHCLIFADSYTHHILSKLYFRSKRNALLKAQLQKSIIFREQCIQLFVFPYKCINLYEKTSLRILNIVEQEKYDIFKNHI